ncbi:hypothetical protein FF011L_24850 [Roseimaritima multifibrata]|uniref:Mucin-like protein n=1 Tax=Roseimaritima multifibrata TaxID=1930274 RepID=A0A517MFQ4_9BACT|nr:DUF481 domain-containing protein [Roseimaritima multifibrata]QDS93712.1 hypothetical protein FF011L_24850 [Roseimaritima multifibrata]
MVSFSRQGHRLMSPPLFFLFSGIFLLLQTSANAQMSWFGSPEDAAAPPVTQVDFAQLGLTGDAESLPAPASPSPTPLPFPGGLPAGMFPGGDQPAGSGVSLNGPSSEVTVTPEPLPLQESTASWYSYPWLWVSDGWTNTAEFGLNGSEGNTNTLSIQTGADLKRETDTYTFAIDFDYFRTKTGGVVTQDNGRVNFDYDRILGDSSWSAFGKLGLEWNEFRPFDLRVNLNGGLGYYWVRDDISTIVTRFGAGGSREIGAPDDSWVPEALFGVEAEHQLTAQQKLKAKLDYFPDWSEFSNYRLVSDIAWEILLDDSENLSLKLAATNRYDSTPQGALPRDLSYSALLLYKF